MLSCKSRAEITVRDTIFYCASGSSRENFLKRQRADISAVSTNSLENRRPVTFHSPHFNTPKANSLLICRWPHLENSELHLSLLQKFMRLHPRSGLGLLFQLFLLVGLEFSQLAQRLVVVNMVMCVCMCIYVCNS